MNKNFVIPSYDELKIAAGKSFKEDRLPESAQNKHIHFSGFLDGIGLILNMMADQENKCEDGTKGNC